MNLLNRLFETDLNRYLITATSPPDDQGPTDELGSRRGTEQLEHEDEQQVRHADGEEPEARRLRERGAETEESPRVLRIKEHDGAAHVVLPPDKRPPRSRASERRCSRQSLRSEQSRKC